MIPTCMLFFNVGFTFISFTFANEYEDEEKMYMLVSPDQHSRTPRLEDFFWTGSGDGPPPPDLSSPVATPSTPIVRTTTVLATVYLDSYPPQAVTDKTSGECVLNCDVTPDSLEPEIPEDRRYWLLTVIQGSTPDSLQLRLARLYQKAFLRQQERHLGIIKSLDAPTSRKKHEVHSFVINKDNNFNQVNPHTAQSPQKFYNVQSSMISLDDLSVNTLIAKVSNETALLDESNKSDHLNYVEMISVNDINRKTKEFSIEATEVNDKPSWILVMPTAVVRKRSIEDMQGINKEDIIDLPLETEEEDLSNGTVLFKREIIKPEQQPPVQVHIQNITESTEGSIQIVYVVLVGGRAVPAAVAARDMRLVRDAEVAKELGAVVTTKAEPAYLKAAEGLEGVSTATVQGVELWALAIGSTIAVLLLLVLLVLLCLAHRKKSIKSAASLRAYRNELIREAERNQMKQINDDKDAKLVSVVSPSRTRPSSVLLPIYRAGSASSSSTSSSGISEVAAALRKRQKKPHALRMPQKKRVGTTDSLLEAAGVGSDSASAPPTPTSYLSMPSVNAFPRGVAVEPLSRILEPVSVRHLDAESPRLARRASAARDPGVLGPRAWRLRPSPAAEMPARRRARFEELVDDAFTLFGSGSRASTPQQHGDTESVKIAQARNADVRVRGRSAGAGGRDAPAAAARPRTAAPAPAWPAPPAPPHSLSLVSVSPAPAAAEAEARRRAGDAALPLISAIKTEIQRVRDNAKPK
ncbi:unnamed protein product, partial [Brenthis ino]